MKHVQVDAFFPELASSHAFQSARGEGSTIPIATGRAVEALFKLSHVRGRRIHAFKLTVSVAAEGTRAVTEKLGVMTARGKRTDNTAINAPIVDAGENVPLDEDFS